MGEADEEAAERRTVSWDGAVNARDLGGLPTEDGHRVRPGALYRSAHLLGLTRSGVQQLLAAPLSRVIDLRGEREVDSAPGPLRGHPVRLAASLIDPTVDHLRDASTERDMADTYRGSLDRNTRTIAHAIAAVADAPEGGVLVHCAAGKDRTGMVVAVLLSLVGVRRDAIVADYAASADFLRSHWASQLASAPPRERDELRHGMQARPTTMTAVLDHLDRTYGGALAYVRHIGLGEQQVEQLRRRLVTA